MTQLSFDRICGSSNNCHTPSVSPDWGDNCLSNRWSSDRPSLFWTRDFVHSTNEQWRRIERSGSPIEQRDARNIWMEEGDPALYGRMSKWSVRRENGSLFDQFAERRRNKDHRRSLVQWSFKDEGSFDFSPYCRLIVVCYRRLSAKRQSCSKWISMSVFHCLLILNRWTVVSFSSSGHEQQVSHSSDWTPSPVLCWCSLVRHIRRTGQQKSFLLEKQESDVFFSTWSNNSSDLSISSPI